MSEFVDVINDALSALGTQTETRLDRMIDDFAALPLAEEERLSVLATVIAFSAATRHRRDKSFFVEAIRCWSLGISAALTPPPPRLSPHPTSGPIDAAEEILVNGMGELFAEMAEQGTEPRRGLIAELALLAQLLGQYDANTIHLSLMAVGRALTGGYRAGDLVRVCLREVAQPLTRDVRLEALVPRGTA